MQSNNGGTFLTRDTTNLMPVISHFFEMSGRTLVRLEAMHVYQVANRTFYIIAEKNTKSTVSCFYCRAVPIAEETPW
jgi:hypothetical protein